MKFPKFQNLCSKDQLRPSMTYVMFTREYIVATDAHILGWVKPSVLIEPTILDELFKDEERLFIPASEWKKIGGKDIVNIEKQADFLMCSTLKDTIAIRFFKDVHYPNWKAVVPMDLNTDVMIQADVLDSICINMQYISLCSSVYTKSDHPGKGWKFRFSGTTKAIVVTPNCLETYKDMGFIIMPILPAK